MPEIERLVDLLSAQYRWGLHPFKLLGALLAPVLIVWIADRRLRARSEAILGPGADDQAVAGHADTVITTR